MTKSEKFQIRASEDEMALWRQAAGEIGLSAWLRNLANAACQDEHGAATLSAEWGRPRVKAELERARQRDSALAERLEEEYAAALERAK